MATDKRYSLCPMNVSQRQATSEDGMQIAAVLLSSKKAFLPYACAAHTDTEVQQWVRDTLVPSGSVTLACVDSLVVGVLATSTSSTVSWVDQLYLAPSHVGQCIGAQLLAHALSTLPLPVRLYTFQENYRARSFYERHGFRVVELTDGSANEERCPDVLYEYGASIADGA